LKRDTFIIGAKTYKTEAAVTKRNRKYLDNVKLKDLDRINRIYWIFKKNIKKQLIEYL